MSVRLRAIEADITGLAVDAIVNAANTTLLGGGGVDGAIHRAAGPELLRECRTLGGCATGDAKITRGYRLASKTRDPHRRPVWNGGASGEPQLLASCYRKRPGARARARVRTIAFPAISCGVYGYPMELAAKIAVLRVPAVPRSSTKRSSRSRSRFSAPGRSQCTKPSLRGVRKCGGHGPMSSLPLSRAICS